MFLDTTSKSLEIIAPSGVGGEPLEWTADFGEVATDNSSSAAKSSNGTVTSSTAVTAVAAPASGLVRQVLHLTLLNPAGGGNDIEVRIRIKDGSSIRNCLVVSFDDGELVTYDHHVGFRVLTRNGYIKTTTLLTGTAGGDLTGTYPNPTIATGAVTEAKQTLADNTTWDVGTSRHGYAPKSPNDATKFLNGVGAYAVPAAAGSAGGDLTGTYPNPTIANTAVTTAKLHDGAVTEVKQTLADNTTWDVSISAHGYAPKAPNDATKYLDGTGAWSVPGGSGSLALTSAHIFVGNGSNVAADVPMSGDATIANTGAVSVDKVKAMDFTASGVAPNSIFIYTGGVWTPTAVGGDLTNAAGTFSVVGIGSKPLNTLTFNSGEVLRYNGTQWVPVAAFFLSIGADVGGAPANNRPLVVDGSGKLAQVTPAADGTTSPVTSITIQDGIITAIS